MRHPIAWALTTAAFCGFGAVSGHAQAMSLGEFEYNNSCAACHGPKGEGDGPVAKFLTVQTLPRLSMLQKNNGGVFPLQRIYDQIEGTTDVAAHGSRDMPVWGDRYRARMQATTDYTYPREVLEDYARVRIFAVIEYLSTLQVQ